MLGRWLIYLVVLSVWACVPDQTQNHGTANIYYDINGLIDVQVKALDSISPSLFKKAIIGDAKEVLEYTPIDSSWSKELMIFRAADINKPILADSYFTVELSDPETKTIKYISKYPETTEVDSLLISYQETRSNPLRIYASLSHENALFTSKKTFEISFLQENNRSLISGYKIRGWQKMISRESTAYILETAIKYP